MYIIVSELGLVTVTGDQVTGKSIMPISSGATSVVNK